MTTEHFGRCYTSSPFALLQFAWPMGAQLEVADRDFVAMSPTGRTIIVYQNDENFSVLDLLLMSELQVSNGHPA